MVDDASSAPASRRPVLPVRLARYAGRWSAPLRRAVHAGAVGVGRPADLAVGFEPARDLGRQWRWSACYAPLTSMYLDQFGHVRACCQNTGHLLGDIKDSTLREIWDGAPAADLRRALQRADLGHGCDFCAWQVTETGTGSAFARGYDDVAAGMRRSPRWPRQLEFSVTNTCNLQCVMCNGDWSSAIRARREGRDALPPAYPERFFDELESFIPHLGEAKFTGGEPFLGREPLRIMDLLARFGSSDLVVTAVTNGTIFTDRTAELLARLKPWIVISLDGANAEVYERIRVGASFRHVMANLERFMANAAATGTRVTLTHCLMVDNWETFPELLLLAEARGLDVAINAVRFPAERSLYQLGDVDLRAVIEGLDARTPQLERSLTDGRLATWHQQLAALRGRWVAPDWPAALGQVPDRPSPPPGANPVAVQLSPTAGLRRRPGS